MLNEEKKWYEKAGKESDVVISTRVRLARNLADMPFPNRMTPDQKAAVERRVRDAILSGNSAIASDFDFVQMDDLSNEQAVSLVERHIVSPEFIANAKGRGFLISKDECISIMVNEEDHVRIQVLHEGLALSEAAEMADRIDTLLNESLRFAFDSELGYLTQCPTNLGTGMRASVMLHLPALTENGAMSRISTNLSKLGLVIRGRQQCHRRHVSAFKPDYTGSQRKRGCGKLAEHYDAAYFRRAQNARFAQQEHQCAGQSRPFRRRAEKCTAAFLR